MSYREKWEDYKKRSRIYWLVVAIFIFALTIGLPLAVTKFPPALFIFICPHSGSQDSPFVSSVIIEVSGNVRDVKNRFSELRRVLNTNYYPIFARHCVNCGLPKWADSESKEN